jgi:hypothetical protein
MFKKLAEISDVVISIFNAMLRHYGGRLFGQESALFSQQENFKIKVH